MPKSAEFLNIRSFESAWRETPRIIKAADLEQVKQAAHIISIAEERAAASERASQAVYEEQKHQGYRDGKREGRIELVQELLRETATLDQSIAKLENRLIDIASQTIRQLAGELPIAVKINAVVQAGLQKMRKVNSVRVLIHPSSIDLKDAIVGLVNEVAPNIEFVDVSADATLSSEQVVFETPLGRIATSLEEELKIIESTALKSLVFSLPETQS